jgi:hypothetical protein
MLLSTFSLQLFRLQDPKAELVVGPLGQLKTVVPASQAGVAPTSPIHFQLV